jgi:hypothetical protein
MILVVVLAELLQDYTVKFARALEQLLNDGPSPRRARFPMLQSLPVVPLHGHGVVTTVPEANQVQVRGVVTTRP